MSVDPSSFRAAGCSTAARRRRAALLAGSLSVSLLAPSVPTATLRAQGARGDTAAPAVALTPSSAPARTRRLPRRYVYAALGAGVGIGLSALYKSGSSYKGTCTSGTCVTFVSTTAGALFGYIIGRESDHLHAVRYRNAAPVSPPTVSAGLTGTPSSLATRDTLVAVVSEGGIELFATPRSILREAGRRAGGVRGVAAVDLVPRSGMLAVAAASGFYLFPAGSGPGALLRQGDASAVAAAPDYVFLAAGSRIEIVPMSTTSTSDTARAWPGVDLGRPVRALAYDASRSLVWAAADSDLVALRPAGDSLTVVSSVRLRASARRLAATATRVAVALGEGGVQLFDVADPAAPAERGRWTGARFAYDVALSPTRLFVAAGSDGLFVLDANGGDRFALGLARGLGFPVGVATRGEHTYVVDRDGRLLHHIPTRF